MCHHPMQHNTHVGCPCIMSWCVQLLRDDEGKETQITSQQIMDVLDGAHTMRSCCGGNKMSHLKAVVEAQSH